MRLIATWLNNGPFPLPKIEIARSSSFRIGYSDWGGSIDALRNGVGNRLVLETDQYGFWRIPNDPEERTFSDPTILESL